MLCTGSCYALSPLIPCRPQGISFFSPRPAGINAARTYSGINEYRTACPSDRITGFVTATPAYAHSIRDQRIAYALFGTDTLIVTGSAIQDRTANQILADYFGLSPTYASAVRIHPEIQNALMIFDGYIILDPLCETMYLQFQLPVAWTRWSMELTEESLNDHENTPFPAGLMAQGEVTPPIRNFKEAFSGTVTFGQMTDPLRYGKITCPQRAHGIADVHAAIGWHPIQRQNCHFGFSFRTIIPTGTHITNEYFFEPFVGNGRHLDLGLGLDGHVLVWEKDGTQHLNLHGIAHLMHQFGAKQRRSFDLRCENGFGSRFILAKEFDANGTYIGQLSPVINHTTLCCNVSVNLYADIVVMLTYGYNDFTWDVGYNGFARSKEKIQLRECVPAERFGLKGSQPVTIMPNMPQLSNATESTATLFETIPGPADDPSPVFFGTGDIDTDSAASPFICTHKLFTSIGKRFDKTCYDHATPFITCGIEIEFEGVNPHNTVQHQRNTLGQWGVWGKAGWYFN